MNTLQLEYFVTIVKHMSFTKASEALYISQPALSNAIKRLETDINSPLFIRSKSDLKLSPSGEILYPIAKNILNEIDTAKRQISAIYDEPFRCNTKVIIPMSDVYIHLIEELMHSYPFLGFFTGNIQKSEIIRMLKNGDAACCIFGHNLDDDQIKSETLATTRHHLIVHKTHPLAERESISIEEFENIKLIARYQGSASRAELEGMCKKYGFTPNIKAESPNLADSLCHKKVLSGELALFGPDFPIKFSANNIEDFRFVMIEGLEFSLRLFWAPEMAKDIPHFDGIKSSIIKLSRSFTDKLDGIK